MAKTMLFTSFFYYGTSKNGNTGFPFDVNIFSADRYQGIEKNRSPLFTYLSKNTIICGIFKLNEGKDHIIWSQKASLCLVVFDHSEIVFENGIPKYGKPLDLNNIKSTAKDLMDPLHFNIIETERLDENIIESLHSDVMKNLLSSKTIDKYDMWGDFSDEADPDMKKNEGFVAIYEKKDNYESVAKIPIYRAKRVIKKIPWCTEHFNFVKNDLQEPSNQKKTIQQFPSSSSSSSSPLSNNNSNQKNNKSDANQDMVYLHKSSDRQNATRHYDMVTFDYTFSGPELQKYDLRKILSVYIQWMFFSPFLTSVNVIRNKGFDPNKTIVLKIISSSIFIVHKALGKDLINYSNILPTFMDFIPIIRHMIASKGKAELFLAYDNYLSIIVNSESVIQNFYQDIKNMAVRPNLPKSFNKAYKKKRNALRRILNNYASIYEYERINLGMSSYGKGNRDRLIRKSDDPFKLGESDGFVVHSETAQKNVEDRLGGLDKDKMFLTSKKSKCRLTPKSKSEIAKKINKGYEMEELDILSTDDFHAFIDATKRWVEIHKLDKLFVFDDTVVFPSSRNRTGGFISLMNYISNMVLNFNNELKDFLTPDVILNPTIKKFLNDDQYIYNTNNWSNNWAWIARLSSELDDNTSQNSISLLDSFYERFVSCLNRKKVYPLFGLIVDVHDDEVLSLYNKSDSTKTYQRFSNYLNFDVHDWIIKIPSVFKSFAYVFSTKMLSLIEKYGKDPQNIMSCDEKFENYIEQNGDDNDNSLQNILNHYVRHIRKCASILSYILTSLFFQKVKKNAKTGSIGGVVHFGISDVFQNFMGTTKIFDVFIQSSPREYKLVVYFLIVFIMIEASSISNIENVKHFKNEAENIQRSFINKLSHGFDGTTPIKFNFMKIVNIIMESNITDLSENLSLLDIDLASIKKHSNKNVFKYTSTLKNSMPIIINTIHKMCFFRQLPKSSLTDHYTTEMDTDITEKNVVNDQIRSETEIDTILSNMITESYESTITFNNSNTQTIPTNVKDSMTYTEPKVTKGEPRNINFPDYDMTTKTKIEDFLLKDFLNLFDIKYFGENGMDPRQKRNLFYISEQLGYEEDQINSFEKTLQKEYKDRIIIHMLITSKETQQTCQEIQQFLTMFIKLYKPNDISSLINVIKSYIKVGYSTIYKSINFCPNTEIQDNKDFLFFEKILSKKKEDVKNIVITSSYGGRKGSMENLSSFIKTKIHSISNFYIMDIETILKLGDVVFDGLLQSNKRVEHVIFDVMHTWSITECLSVFKILNGEKFKKIMENSFKKTGLSKRTHNDTDKPNENNSNTHLWFLSYSNTSKGFGYDVVRDISRLINILMKDDILTSGLEVVINDQTKMTKKIIRRPYLRNSYYNMSKNDEVFSHQLRIKQWDANINKFVFIQDSSEMDTDVNMSDIPPNSDETNTSSKSKKKVLRLSYEDIPKPFGGKDIKNSDIPIEDSLIHPKNILSLESFLLGFIGQKILVVYGNFPNHVFFDKNTEYKQCETTDPQLFSENDDEQDSENNKFDTNNNNKAQIKHDIYFSSENRHKKFHTNNRKVVKDLIKKCTSKDSNIISMYKWCQQKGSIINNYYDINSKLTGGYDVSSDFGNLVTTDTKNRYGSRKINYDDQSYSSVIFLGLESYTKYELDMCFIVNRAIELTTKNIYFEATEDFIKSAFMNKSKDDSCTKYNNNTTFYTSKYHMTSNLFESLVSIFPTKN